MRYHAYDYDRQPSGILLPLLQVFMLELRDWAAACIPKTEAEGVARTLNTSEQCCRRKGRVSVGSGALATEPDLSYHQ